MSQQNGENPRLHLTPAAIDVFLQEFRTALQRPAVCAIIIDFGDVARVDPALLQALRAASDDALGIGKDVYVDRALPTVYKALQLAKLTPPFKRLHHATATA